MRPLSLKLRGAAGIASGLGLDKIEIDFTKFSPGLVGIVGPNGAGKSTILENLHAFPQMATLTGGLSNFFTLRDSYRDFTFAMGGAVYRALIVMDARTGKSEAYLYKDGQAVNDGKMNTYKAAVEALLGSPDLFFRSIFAAQKAESITALPPSKRKELFIELLGLSRFEQYAQYAKTNADRSEQEIGILRARLEPMETEVARRGEVTEQKELTLQELKQAENKVEAHEQILSVDRNLLVELDTKKWRKSELEKLIHDVRNEIGVIQARGYKAKVLKEEEIKKINDELDEISAEIIRKEEIVSHAEEIRTKVARIAELTAEKEKLVAKERELSTIALEEQRELAVYTHESAQQAIAAKVRELDYEQKTTVTTFAERKKELGRRLTELLQAAALVDEVPCRQVSGMPERCMLLTSAIAAKGEVPAAEMSFDELDTLLAEQLEEFGKERLTLEQELANLVEPPDGISGRFAVQKAAVGYDADQYRLVVAEITDLDRNGWINLERELSQAETIIAGKREAVASMRSRRDNVEKTLTEDATEFAHQSAAKWAICRCYEAELQTLVDIGQQLQDLSEKITCTTDEIKKLTESRSRLLGDVQFQTEMLNRLDRTECDIIAVQAELKATLTALEHWRLLQRSCSKDGIPALEMDASGPEVSRIANELLSSTFGSKFQIAFETTRQTKDGKKQVETFEITVFGPEGEKKIMVLLDGEKALEDQLHVSFTEAGLEDRIDAVVLDIMHAMDYLWEAGTALYGEKGKERRVRRRSNNSRAVKVSGSSRRSERPLRSFSPNNPAVRS